MARERRKQEPGRRASDKVNHPPHYNTGSIEVIDAIEDWGLGFCLGNAVKYVARADQKGTALDDLRKAVWYLEREIQTRTLRGGSDAALLKAVAAAHRTHGSLRRGR